MSSRPPGQDRFTQMSEQAAIIARKKAEIEAKLKAAAEGGGGGKSDAVAPPSVSPSSSPSAAANSFLPQKASKNRW